MNSIPIIFEGVGDNIKIPGILLNSEFNFIDNSIDVPYIYYISINDVFYFMKHEKVGFSYLNESIKKDIISGKCKLIMYQQDEGEFGSEKTIEYDILEKWISNENFPINSVHFVCLNLIIDSVSIKNNMKIVGHPNVYNSERYPTIPFDIHNDSFYNIGLTPNHKIFLNYNKSNRFNFRRYLMLEYIKNDLLSDGLISFSQDFKTPQTLDIVKTDSEFDFDDDIIDYYINMESLYIDDVLPSFFNKKNSELINLSVDDLGQLIQMDHYKNSFVSLVSETLVLKDTVYLSEKTFKPIIMGHPFITVSSTGTLKKIKELGYKTFDRWWDESYDECETYQERIKSIIEIIKKLKQKTPFERTEMRTEMLDVLKYNQELYRKRCTIEEPISDIIKNIYKELLNENNISYGM